MDSNLFADLLEGPYGFLVAIAALLWLCSREIRKARAEDVVEAREEAKVERERRLQAEAATETLREDNRRDREATLRKYYIAREKAIAKGVPPEELP